MTTRLRSKLSWRWLTCAATAVAAMAFPAEAQPVSYDGWKVVTVQAATPSALQTLEAIPHEALYGHGGIGRNIVLVSPSSAQALAASGLPYTVDVNNYQDYLDDVATRRAMYESVPAQQLPIYMTNPFTGVPSGNIGVITQALNGPPPVIESAWYWTWHTQEEVFDKLKALRDTYAAATDLDLEVFSLGTTFEGREIPTLRITGPVQQGQRPALYPRAGIHAAEQVGVLASLYMVEAMLSTYANGDQRMIELVKNVEIYLTPLQNPDGYAFFRESGNLSVRKNRRDYRDTANDCTPETVQSVGVELNRNWDIEWCKYESMDRCRRDYCGPSPMSELEVQAMADFMLRTPNLAANIDIHAFSQLVLIPWAHTYDDSNPQAEDRPHKAVYEQLQREVISEINAVHSATYGDEVGYALGGGSTDWTQAQGLWSLAYEVRPLLLADNYPDDFEPENSEQYPTAVWTGEELLQGTLHFAEFLVADLDQDGVINGFDNCPDVQNFAQRDCDGNHIGDACDDVTPRCSSDAVIVLDRSGSMAERDGASGASRGAHALSGFGAYLYNSFSRLAPIARPWLASRPARSASPMRTAPPATSSMSGRMSEIHRRTRPASTPASRWTHSTRPAIRTMPTVRRTSWRPWSSA
jgi:Zinc carboxypeptidase